MGSLILKVSKTTILKSKMEKMKAIILVCLLSSSFSSPMFQQPPITRAVCDDSSFLIYPKTKWCYPPNKQGPCRVGELFVPTGEGNIGKCK